jgi:hypothetical protein
MCSNIMKTAVSYDTYRLFAKKYNIRLTKATNGKRTPKSFSTFKREIKLYEKKHNIKNGLYY